MEKQIINKFRGDYSFLSNFSFHPMRFNGMPFLSSEAAYQSQKCPKRASEFSHLDANSAKQLGKHVNIRDDWSDVKLDVMEAVLRTKFIDPELKEKLINTYPHEIVEGNTWGDTFWGVDLETNEGQNNLGKLLMKIRDEFIHRRKLDGRL